MSGWTSFTAKTNEELAAKLAEHGRTRSQGQEPLAEIVIRVLGLDPGQSSVQIKFGDHSPLAASRTLAYQRIAAIVAREVGQACDVLAEHQASRK